MKRIAMMTAAIVLMGSVAMAQGEKKDGQRQGRKLDKTEIVKHRTDDMVQKYGLDADQASKLLALNTQYADKMQPAFGRHHGPRRGGPGAMQRPPRRASVDAETGATRPEGRKADGKRPELTEEQKQKMAAERQEMEKTMNEYEAGLQKIMTADQYAQYKADAQRHRGHGPRPGGKDGKDRKEKAENANK